MVSLDIRCGVSDVEGWKRFGGGWMLRGECALTLPLVSLLGDNG